MREWRDIHSQLHALATEHGWRESEQPAGYEAIHKALLTGLLGHIGCKVEDASGPTAGSYLGARAIKFWPHPGSYLKKTVGRWLMAAELIDTSKLYARCLAKIEPEWVEEVGAHLVKRSVYEPHWEKRFGAVRAWESGVLHGITLYPRRAVGYAEHDPKLCREMLIREGLVQADIDEAALRHMSFPAPQPETDGRDRAPGAQDPAPRRARRRESDLRFLRCADSPRMSSICVLSTPGARAPSGRTRRRCSSNATS